jgi:predicted RND superfamily exporter protein
MSSDLESSAPWQRKVEAVFERWGHFVIRHRVAALVVSLGATALLLAQLPKLTVDNSPEALLLDDDPAVVEYDAFREQFGREDRLIVLVRTPDPFAPAFLERLRDLHEAIEAEIPFVEEVDSLIDARVVDGEAGELVVGELLEDWPASPEGFEKVRAEALSNPLYVDSLLCADGSCTALSIKPFTYSESGEKADDLSGFETDPAIGAAEGAGGAASNDAEERPVYLTAAEGDALMAALRPLLARWEAPDFGVHVAGVLAMTYRINQGMAADLSTFLPLTLASIAVLLGLIFRRAVAVVLPLMVVVLSLAATLGLMIVLGIPGSTAVQILPVFLLTVGVCDAVHILAIAYQRRREGATQEAAIAGAIGHTGLAVFMTSATTAAGMASFLTAEMGAVRDLGLIAPIGVALAYVYTMVTLPALLALVPMRGAVGGPVHAGESPIDRFLVSAGRFAARHPMRVLAPTALLTLVAIAGLFQVRFSHNALDWFPRDDPAANDFRTIDADLGGSVSLDLVFETPEPGGLYEPAILRRIDEFVAEVRGLAQPPIEVGSSVSVLDIVKETHEALHEDRPEERRIPETREAIAQEMLLFESSGSDDTEELVDGEFRRMRVNLRLPFVDALAFPPFLRSIDALASARLGDGLDFHVTGMMTLLSQVFEAVISSMAKSYVAALLMITPLMMLLLGSFRRGLVAMIPNVLPILAVLGVMGFAGIALDSTTMMIGAMVIGIAVDDTIHFMHKFHRHFDDTADLEYAVCETLRTTGSAMLFTSVALTLGFVTFAGSQMTNIRIFGLFSAFATVVAFAADLWVGPALLAWIERTRRRSRGADAGGGGSSAEGCATNVPAARPGEREGAR